jgi:hypothetical protein
MILMIILFTLHLCLQGVRDGYVTPTLILTAWVTELNKKNGNLQGFCCHVKSYSEEGEGVFVIKDHRDSGLVGVSHYIRTDAK